MQKTTKFKIARIGILLTISSILVNLIFFSLTKALGEQYIIPMTEAPTVTGPMPVFLVILATLLAALLVTGLYGILAKVAPRATLPPFLSISATAFLVSLGGPMELPGTHIQTKLLLSTMHIITAFILIGGFVIHNRRSRIQVD